MKIFIHYTDAQKLYKINIACNSSFIKLKQRIVRVAHRKNINLDFLNLRIRHINKYVTMASTLKLAENDTLYITTHKLCGGGIDSAVGLPIIYMNPPIWAVTASIIGLVGICPVAYILLLNPFLNKSKNTPGKETVNELQALVDDTGQLRNYNNYYIRKKLDDVAYIDIINRDYEVWKYLLDCKFSLFKSKLYVLFFVLYAIFIVFTSNLYFMTKFMGGFTDNQYKCFVHTNPLPLSTLMTSICVVVPIILFLMSLSGYKNGIFVYLLTLIVGSVCVYTSVYWNKMQNYKDAMKYRDTDPTIHNGANTYVRSSVEHMPNYFRYLLHIPFIVCVITLVCYVMHIHPLMWGILVAFMGSLPAYYVLQNTLPLYCNNSFRFSKSFAQLQTIINNDNYTNLKAPYCDRFNN